MLTVSEALDRAQMLCDAAAKAGADAADALYYCNAATSVSMRLGALEDVERSEGQDISLRVFVGQRSASVSTADMDAGELTKLVERCVAMAREAPEDPYAGLAPEELLFKEPVPDFDLDDNSEADPAALRTAALAVEEAARAVTGVTNSEGGSASHSRTRFALATSHGFAGGYGSSGHSLSASVIAGEGASMQRDYGWHSAHHLADLESAADIGNRAGTRAVARLNPGKAPNGKLPVLLDPRVSGGIVGHLLGAIAGPAIARGTSFLLGKEEQTLFDSGIIIRDEPHRARGLRSRAFDGEGLPTAARDIVAGGKITGWLLDTASAKQLGLAPTGHASRGGGASGVGASNLHLAAGSVTPAALMEGIADGVYITELIGHGVNPVTGDYSRGASGFLIKDGALAGPIAEFTIAGNLIDMFAGLIPANDLEFRHGTNAPTLRIDGMTVASS
ncbi:modulator protein [Sphingopyxis sp. H038]|uniref:TldD/PmbA family protein n=1 Tax=unclassified Sphingopyxis TaxID=2614943 RepID=UPI000731262A|nr:MULTISPECIES: metallopeptidase TldD-related protein [unclassified Sphingopyxis]KTE00285.1 modulator protein [Sphingopyxis sp. H012]KTE06452.1 modulator protein [Sphingopyxis sp. H053]KTE07273.1 modulator protein [Sphingopyxis sp. H093]KTE28852.1 modulator protein [Sphingopyxis sp. H080]KTE31627.1 modulator protein [Sphingopyxis sp. H038]